MGRRATCTTRAAGKDFKLHPVELLKVSTPNTGTGFDLEPPRFVHISTPGGLWLTTSPCNCQSLTSQSRASASFSTQTPKHQAAVAAMAISSANPLQRKGKKNTKPPVAGRGTFILTSFSASADPVPGDNVNLNRLLGVSQVTADSWLANWRPEGVIDTRGDDGWSPEAVTAPHT